MSSNPNMRPPLPPFTRETALQKVRLAEDGWNSRDPERVSLVYTVDSQWRNRAEFFSGRAAIVGHSFRSAASYGMQAQAVERSALHGHLHGD